MCHSNQHSTINPNPPVGGLRSTIQQSNGFTLIELLVVVAIIAVLVAILLPALSRARDQAYEVSCASRLRQMGLGITSYANDYNGWLPGPRYPTDSSYIKSRFVYYGLGIAFEGKYIGPKILYCPCDKERKVSYWTGHGWAYTDQRRDIEHTAYARARSYTYHPYLLTKDTDGNGIIDGYERDRLDDGPGRVVSSDPLPWWGNLARYHPDGVNILYMDGSVAFRRYDSICHNPTTNWYQGLDY